MKKPTRSPLKNPPVRNPGQSLDEQRLRVVADRLITPLIAAAIFGVVAMQEWLRHFTPRQPMPWLFSAIFAATVGFFLYRLFRTRPEIRRLKLGRDGERAVGQYFERLRADGYEVFHDVIGEGFDVDHVLIGPGGVFTIETKSYSKPASGPTEINFDGEQVAIGGWQPDRNHVIQARAKAVRFTRRRVARIRKATWAIGSRFALRTEKAPLRTNNSLGVGPCCPFPAFRR
ncbi:MAG: nuclease-related domain-containing protein [Wenzhouxiangellaceae bacterium]|nr:nuclease-related domain-containing protein [Wenzhouxiangellaceae bacterium]